MFINRNKEYSQKKYLSDKSDFIYWKYFLDIEPKNIEEEQNILNIRELIRYLKTICTGVVIACDFEDEINRIDTL